ncbi:hypothetical protein FA13DRAFT_1745664 [Coprinellus micaceus]|uniref:Ubiquitin 3 binding protein But2 C-terminal domain-containing protein n=1 Tax=Coprinellus micaceus TaxID=71717 RepID=A0A4Y7SCD0_COPMI|nr:hypothetical protein FA13DRAFT_1745664 [Coprinellus micaceus]
MSAYYIPLEDISQEDGLGVTSYHPGMTYSEAHQSSTPRNAGWTTYAALAILVLCTIVNTVQPSSQHRALTAFAGQKLGDMREPSKYIGLNKFSPTSESEDSFKTFPIFLSQIDSTRKSLIFDGDNQGAVTDLGTIWPDARRLWVEGSVSSVAQFRLVDFGYENCSFALFLRSNSGDVAEAILPHSPTPVNIWLHDDAPQIPSGSLSYNTLYRRSRTTRRLHETVELQSTRNTEGRTFPCPSGTLLTVEVSCHVFNVGDGQHQCHVEFWNDPLNSKFGMMVTQSKGFVSTT